MELIKIKVTQETGHYRVPETLANRLTFPLPPYSTIIGAINNICGFTEYKPMQISITGSNKGVEERVYTHHEWLNSPLDDRGDLYYMQGVKPTLVSESLSQGSFHRKRQLSRLHREDLLEKFIKEGSPGFASKVTSLKRYQLLKQLKLIIHIHSDAETMASIESNVESLVHLGRAEDFVGDIICTRVSAGPPPKEEEIETGAWVPFSLIGSGEVITFKDKGTRYQIPKEYQTVKGRREFNFIDVAYLTDFIVEEESERALIDQEGDVVLLV